MMPEGRGARRAFFLGFGGFLAVLGSALIAAGVYLVLHALVLPYAFVMPPVGGLTVIAGAMLSRLGLWTGPLEITGHDIRVPEPSRFLRRFGGPGYRFPLSALRGLVTMGGRTFALTSLGVLPLARRLTPAEGGSLEALFERSQVEVNGTAIGLAPSFLDPAPREGLLFSRYRGSLCESLPHGRPVFEEPPAFGVRRRQRAMRGAITHVVVALSVAAVGAWVFLQTPEPSGFLISPWLLVGIIEAMTIAVVGSLAFRFANAHGVYRCYSCHLELGRPVLRGPLGGLDLLNARTRIEGRELVGASVRDRRLFIKTEHGSLLVPDIDVSIVDLACRACQDLGKRSHHWAYGVTSTED
jgi:hypothetical protein